MKSATVVWDNAFVISFSDLPPGTAVNHLVRTSEVGHKVSCEPVDCADNT